MSLILSSSWWWCVQFLLRRVSRSTVVAEYVFSSVNHSFFVGDFFFFSRIFLIIFLCVLCASLFVQLFLRSFIVFLSLFCAFLCPLLVHAVQWLMSITTPRYPLSSAQRAVPCYTQKGSPHNPLFPFVEASCPVLHIADRSFAALHCVAYVLFSGCDVDH